MMGLKKNKRKFPSSGKSFSLLFFLVLFASMVAAFRAFADKEGEEVKATPIKHLVVIFQENISFDHYFGTYPKTIRDSKGHVVFRPKKGTPAVNGLTKDLLTHNPNSSQ